MYVVGVHNTEYVVGDTASSVASDRKFNETPNSLDNVDPELDERISDDMLNDDDMRRLQVSHVVGPKAYYIGIVDFQQEFDLPKKVMFASTCEIKLCDRWRDFSKSTF